MKPALFKKFKAFVFLGLAFGLLYFGFYLFNQGKEIAYGQAVEITYETMTCYKTPAFPIPPGPILGPIPNDLEMPVGQSTDRAERVAEKVLEQIDIILGASDRQVGAAKELVFLPNQCRSSNCSTGCQESTRDDCAYPCPGPPECNPHDCNCGEDWCFVWDYSIDPPTCLDLRAGGCETCYDPCTCYKTIYACQVKSCSGDPCPSGKIAELRGNIEGWHNMINAAYKTIEAFFIERTHQPIGCWWLSCPDSKCRPEVTYILDLLEKSRSGDYLFCNIFRDNSLEWYHKPPGLKDCVDRPVYALEIEEGLLTSQLLLTCKETMQVGLLDETLCYGNPECMARLEMGESAADLKANLMCPRDENYYCCN